MTDAAPTANPHLTAALDAVARGWHVFPCEPRGKRPLTAHGLNDATIDADQVRAWWERTPAANVAIVTGAVSGLVVVDVDSGKDGETTLELLEALHGELPDTVRAITGGDGWHYLFAHPGAEIRNTAGKLGKGIDTRGDGGYIIAAPSLHESGQRYEWILGPDEIDLAELPEWVKLALERPVVETPPLPRPAGAPLSNGITPYARKVLEERSAEVARAGDGTRNHTLNQAAFRLGQLVAGGQVAEHDVTTTLTRAAAVCGLGETEIARTIRSGLDAGAREPQLPDPARARPQAARLDPDAAPAGGDHSDVDDSAEPRVTVVTEQGELLADGQRGTDAGNANRFVAGTDGHARYVHAWGRWIVYDDLAGVWHIDNSDALVTEMAKNVARTMFTNAIDHSGGARDALLKWAKRSESANAIAAMIRLARGVPGVLVDHDRLDADPWLLNVANGTIDLTTGALRRHNPDDLLTLQAPTRYESDAATPLWDACLERWQPDPEMRRYLQQVIGTGATGHPIEHLFINLGPGGNGKGKFYKAIATVLGGYVVIPHKSLITVQRHEQHDTVKARLFRARLAIASETDANDRIDEAKVKDLTGGDLLEARRMREDPWKFEPSHTMVMHTNHRPRVRGTDEGVWRRLRLIPWNVSIPKAEQDEQLSDKLAAEASGILAWIVAGALDWRAAGLVEPSSVAVATASYRADEDTLAGFLEEHCETHDSYRERMSELRKAYELWCEESGNEPVTKTSFGKMLNERGFGVTSDRRFRTGLRLLESEDARVARVAQMTLHAGAQGEPMGERAQRAHDHNPPPGRTDGLDLPPDTWEL